MWWALIKPFAAYISGALFGVSMLGGLYFWGHSNGHAAGVESESKKTAKVETARAAAIGERDACRADSDRVRASLEAAAQKAEAQRKAIEIEVLQTQKRHALDLADARKLAERRITGTPEQRCEHVRKAFERFKERTK